MPPEMTPEQQEELRKKLESMSPEELKEFQKKQCVFCHIVNGKVQARKIYEDKKVIAILDINPANPGHILLLPKEHHMIMPHVPSEDLQYIFVIAKQLSNVLLRTLEVRGTNIIVANGQSAGQRSQHFMIHIIPRKEGDGLQFKLPVNKHTEEALDRVADLIRKKLNHLTGSKQEFKSASEIIKESHQKNKLVEPPKKEEPVEIIPPPKKEDDEELDLDSISKVLNG
jgi:histidine triad (HIT) family protein